MAARNVLGPQIYGWGASPETMGSHPAPAVPTRPATPTAPNSAGVSVSAPKLKFALELDFGDYDAVLRLAEAYNDDSRKVGGCVQDSLNYLVRSCCGGRRRGTDRSIEDAAAQVEDICEAIRRVCDLVGKRKPLEPKSNTKTGYTTKDADAELRHCKEELEELRQKVAHALDSVANKTPDQDPADYRNLCESLREAV